MLKDLHVLLIEDDAFSRDLMSMLLTRDWRTRVIGEIGSEADVRKFLEDSIQRVDLLLIDAEVQGDPEWPFRIAAEAHDSANHPAVVFTASKGDPDNLRRAVSAGYEGYLIKQEIGYSLAASVTIAARSGHFVLTPGGYTMALQQRIDLPEGSLVLDGRKSTTHLTPREAEIARLAILFNQPYRDLSDELLIRADQVAKHVSSIYSKLGLDEFLAGEIRPEAMFEDPLIVARFSRILERVAAGPGSGKTADMATLAFHLLTVPEVRTI